ncbi:glutaminyl-peptide cyclotransferase [Myroides pelagicus]|uniref:Glutaminyl-peptide cyclotransferase n=1 Tax=Myroides pelagicus TaxID=270914 RepID=A0A7K1GME1_9FLAO|nr:glutaminyl-peptide cyclotransferase [Myroides pelagicus]MEC4113073.1 glutaminyl-peptide cyclotransferase [Myroides pelagicus]MTH29978.1 glutaminyl-peptide cyclotransferase [Myroides pelagicus]
MKKYNLLVALSLGIAFISCSNKKNLEKNVISIDTTQLKRTYSANEEAKFTLKTVENAEIDSVAYFLDNKKIGSVKNNDVLKYALNQEKLGKKEVKAIAYADNNTREFDYTIEIVSAFNPIEYDYKIIKTYPHDQNAYTQGLEFHKGILYESTGNGEGGGSTGKGTGKKGKSSVRKVDYKTGKVIQINELDDIIFGEGCTILNNKLYQLTYLNKEAFTYNLETLAKEETLKYFADVEGWGLTNDGEFLYMSVGSEKIYKVNPKTFELVDTISVYSPKGALPYINELEWVDGKIYANVYGYNSIVIIDPKTGALEGLINFNDLLNLTTYHDDRDVFNGVAYNPETKTFFVTGKNWDKLFEIQIIK